MGIVSLPIPFAGAKVGIFFVVNKKND